MTVGTAKDRDGGSCGQSPEKPSGRTAGTVSSCTMYVLLCNTGSKAEIFLVYTQFHVQCACMYMYMCVVHVEATI